MAISFPTSPVANQTYTVGSKTWIWNGYAWDLQIANTQTVTTLAQSAYTTANSAQANTVLIQGVDVYQNNNISIVQGGLNSANANISLLFAIDNTQNANTVIVQGGLNTANANIALIFGIDTSQNTRMTAIESVDTVQNTNITIVQGGLNTANANISLLFAIDNAQNSNTTIVQGGLNSANANIALIQSVDVYQNNNINIVQGGLNSANANIAVLQIVANTDYTTVSTTPGTYGSSSLVPVVTVAANGRVTNITTTSVSGGGSSSGYLANSVIFANSTGYLSNTANIQFFQSNNNLLLANTITAANLVLTGTTPGSVPGNLGALQVAGGAYFGQRVYGAQGFNSSTGIYQYAGANFLGGSYLTFSQNSLFGSTATGFTNSLGIYNPTHDVIISTLSGIQPLTTFNTFFGPKIITSNNPITYSDLATFYISAPSINVANTNLTVTNNWALYANGAIYSNTNIRAANTFFAGSNGITFADGTKQTTAASGSGGSSNSFSTILVSGQANVIANTPTSQLTLVAGSGMTITTDGISNTVTFASSGGFSGGTIANQLIVANTFSSYSNSNNALQISGGIGVANSIYVGNRVGFGNTTQSFAYEVYNPTLNSLDTYFS